jgi:hypothetical protein
MQLARTWRTQNIMVAQEEARGLPGLSALHLVAFEVRGVHRRRKRFRGVTS